MYIKKVSAGFIRDDDGVYDYGFIAKYADEKIIELKEINQR